MAKLNEVAKQQLRDAGISQAEWARRNGFSDGKWWYGDACGCVDDRCVGYHHGETQDCGCLPALMDELHSGDR